MTDALADQLGITNGSIGITPAGSALVYESIRIGVHAAAA